MEKLNLENETSNRLQFEQAIIKVLSEEKNGLARALLKEKVGLKGKDDSYFQDILKFLSYFEYIEKFQDNGIVSYKIGSEKYNLESRKDKKIEEDHTFLFNKVFTGAYLGQNLAHEIINFMIADDKKRYVYINPWGKCAYTPKYVIHIIKSAKDQKYELVGISEINEEKPTITPKFQKLPYKESDGIEGIFDNETVQTNGVTFLANKFYVPNEGKKIYIETGKTKTKIIQKKNELTISVISNPQHSISYACNGDTISHKNNIRYSDIAVLTQLFSLDFLKEENASFEFKDIPDELPYCVISGRTSLEVSMSNLIAYFLGKDPFLCRKFLKETLKIKDIDNDEEFEIIRETEKNIDLLFKSDKHIIIIENKVDSDINGQQITHDENDKIVSQLSKYYEYVQDKYVQDKYVQDEYVENNNDQKKYKANTCHFFILVPSYSEINKEYLDTFMNGSNYTLIKYDQVYKMLESFEYHPYGTGTITEEQNFLFKQFKKNIQLLTLSKAEQQKQIAYIRLKQRIKYLTEKYKFESPFE